MHDLNFKNMIDRVFKKIEDRLYLKKEYVYVALACLVLIFGFSVMNRTTDNAVNPEKQAAVTDSVQNDNSQTGIETQSLRDVALQLGISPDELMAMLRKKGIKLNNTDDTLEQIAKDNHIATGKLIDIVHKDQKGSLSIKHRTGARFGGLTLEEFCDQNNLSLNEILTRFEMLGFKIDSKDKMKQIAKNLAISNIELENIITGSTQ